jgi:hypothetical protein
MFGYAVEVESPTASVASSLPSDLTSSRSPDGAGPPCPPASMSTQIASQMERVKAISLPQLQLATVSSGTAAYKFDTTLLWCSRADHHRSLDQLPTTSIEIYVRGTWRTRTLLPITL